MPLNMSAALLVSLTDLLSQENVENLQVVPNTRHDNVLRDLWSLQVYLNSVSIPVRFSWMLGYVQNVIKREEAQ